MVHRDTIKSLIAHFRQLVPDRYVSISLMTMGDWSLSPIATAFGEA